MDVQLKVNCRKAVEIHWSENRSICSTLPKLCTAWLFTQKISVQIQKKQQTWQESIPGFRSFPAQSMLSSSLLSCSLGSLHFLREISLTLASNSWWDSSSMGCAPKKWSHFSPFLLHVVFYSKYSLACQINGMGEEQGDAYASLGRKELSGWNDKFPVSWGLKFHSGHWVVAWIKAKSGIQNLVPTSSLCVILLFQGAAPRGPHGTLSCSALLRLVLLDALTCKLMKQMKTENHTIFKGND